MIYFRLSNNLLEEKSPLIVDDKAGEQKREESAKKRAEGRGVVVRKKNKTKIRRKYCINSSKVELFYGLV
jgi:hypothetical protein